jgi:hypothetical protein
VIVTYTQILAVRVLRNSLERYSKARAEKSFLPLKGDENVIEENVTQVSGASELPLFLHHNTDDGDKHR